MLAITLQHTAQARLNELFYIAVKKIAVRHTADLFTQPSLMFTQRGKIAASALLQKNIIKINPILYAQNTDYFISHTIAHELAHIMVYQLYGLAAKPHGLQWQKIMLEIFNVPPKVTHTLDVSAVAMREVVYKCVCQVIPLSLIRHNKVVRGKQSYVCRKCKTVLTPLH